MLTLTFHGDACFTLEADGRRVIIDPFLTGNPATDIPLARLPKIDAVLLSHGHGDHLGDAIPIARRDDHRQSGAGPVLWRARGHRACHAHRRRPGVPLRSGQARARVPGGAVEGDATGQFTTNPCRVVVTMGGRTVYHCGDTGLTMEMQLLAGRVDAMLVPIGDNYTIGVEDAVRAVEFVQPRAVIPMHYNTWDVIKADPEQFKRQVGGRARVVVLAPGEAHTLS